MRERETTRTRRALRVCGLGAAVCGVLLAVGCGGGGGSSTILPGTGAVQPAIAIDDTTLPLLHVGVPLGELPLTAHTPSGRAARWYLDGGHLPPGIEISSDGTLSGTPTAAGLYAFDARVVDGAYAVVVGLALAVDAFGLYIRHGLLAGDAVEGVMLHVATAGGEGVVQLDAQGPGVWAWRDEAAGSGAFLPGPASVGGTLELRAVDASGREAALSIDLRPDVTAGYQAEWGASDVWHLDLDVRLGDHAYSTDFHAALAQLGLRRSTSTDAAGTAADRLAARCVRVELHRRLSQFFLREADGSPGTSALAISFSYDEPGVGYYKPAAGTYMLGGARGFSVMAFGFGTRGGIVGTAFVDDQGNPRHENDTTGGQGEFGVFLNMVTPYFAAAWSNVELPDAPIEAADIDALRAVLYGEPVSGARALEVERIVQGYARALATVAAHEVGHSLGLEHNASPQAGSLMNAYASLGPMVEAGFLPARVQALRSALPGLGRPTWSVQAPQLKTALPAGGVSVCGGRCCNLRLPAQPLRAGAPE